LLTGNNRRKNIYQLEQEEGTIVGQDNLKTYISKYNKALFGAPIESSVSLVENFNNDIPQISQDENNILTAEFTETEV
jgi:hypothetical protein